MSWEISLAVEALTDKKPYGVTDVTTDDPRLEFEIARDFKSKSFAVVPLLVKDKPVGVIWVDRGKSKKTITDEDVDLLASFASQAAIAIENTRLYKKVKTLAAAEERNKLARDVHDGLAQSLSSIVYQLEIVLSQLKKNPLKARQRVQDLQEFASWSPREAREYISDLRGRTSKEYDLGLSLAKFTEGFSRYSGITTDFKSRGDFQALTPERAAALYWVAREALNNTAKHAQAKRVKVELTGQPDIVTLVISDNGKGFLTVPQPDGGLPQAFGLSGMRERMNEVGGFIEIESSPELGTKIIVSVDSSGNGEVG